MLANQSQEMTGTAPEAEYYLFKTEVNGSELPVEEDYWVAAVEYADSLGVDIVSTSLGYFTFNTKPEWNHSPSELDGQTAPASRAAAMAAYKGMILCLAAGNEGNKDWKMITFPSDADNILTVGAIASDSTLASFSSQGYIRGGKVKPDIVAMGLNAAVWGANGKRTDGRGTSFSCPIISGLTASLWQALPELNSLQLMDLIRKSANRYQNPDDKYGYGIPDFFKAYTDGKNGFSILSSTISEGLAVVMEGDRIYIRDDNDYLHTAISIYTSMGAKAMESPAISGCIDTSALPEGVYIACMQKDNKRYVYKFVKQ
jgi:subtilisin family serine protease